MMIPYGGFEFSTTINAGPEKAKTTDASFDILSGFTRSGSRRNEKSRDRSPGF
ncbi:hypothetical protein [Paraburkholderia elongata]|uniref:Uncharacterized protein n=1 Tax=Paraburkholderia elongata TaxID=2675747 RepID=A0A972NUK4_9BURK|nr:hypothetical protein [Paraburkholderia elongata]NPT59976.1 hypothetical protein [Paraburkholderia elongata]